MFRIQSGLTEKRISSFLKLISKFLITMLNKTDISKGKIKFWYFFSKFYNKNHEKLKSYLPFYPDIYSNKQLMQTKIAQVYRLRISEISSLKLAHKLKAEVVNLRATEAIQFSDWVSRQNSSKPNNNQFKTNTTWTKLDTEIFRLMLK